MKTKKVYPTPLGLLRDSIPSSAGSLQPYGDDSNRMVRGRASWEGFEENENEPYLANCYTDEAGGEGKVVEDRG